MREQESVFAEMVLLVLGKQVLATATGEPQRVQEFAFPVAAFLVTALALMLLLLMHVVVLEEPLLELLVMMVVLLAILLTPALTMKQLLAVFQELPLQSLSLSGRTTGTPHFPLGVYWQRLLRRRRTESSLLRSGLRQCSGQTWG